MKRKKRTLRQAVRLWRGAASGILFVASALSAGRIIRFVENHFTKEKKRDRAARFMIISAWCTGICLTLAASVQLLLKYIRKQRGGYLLDLFDRQKFSIADSIPDAEQLEQEVRRNLRENDLPYVSGDSVPRGPSVPTDEEATEFNIG